MSSEPKLANKRDDHPGQANGLIHNLRSIVDNLQDTIYQTDIQGLITWASRPVHKLLGHSPEELVGTTLSFLYVDESDCDRFLLSLENSGGHLDDFRSRLRHKDGSEIWVSINAAYFYDEADEVLGIAGSIRDISNLINTEQAFLESEQKFRSLAETSANCIFVYREKFLYVNPALETITGYSSEELLQKNVCDIVHPDFHELILSRSRARLTGKLAPQRYELKFISKNGDERWLDFASGIIQFEGVPAGVASALDITEQKAAHNALRLSEERFRKVFEANAAVITINKIEDGEYIDVNESFVKVSGFSREEAIGRTSLDLGVWDKPEDRKKLVQDLQNKGFVHDFEFGFRSKSGELKHVLSSAEKVDIAGCPCLLFIGLDISDRKKYENALRASEEKYRLLVDNAKDAIFIAQGPHVKFPNPMALEISGYNKNELEKKSLHELIHPDDRQMVLNRYKNRLAGNNEPDNYQFQILTRSGTARWVENSVMLITWEDRPATLNVMRDITAHKTAQEALFDEKERAQVTLESIGDGVITTNAQGCIEYLNPVAEQLVGWQPNQAQGLKLVEVFNIIDESTRTPIHNPVETVLHQGQKVMAPGQTSLIRADGSESSIEYAASPIRHRDGSIIGAVVVFRDVTEMRGLARQLSHQASHDSLTGLINRHEFENRLNYAMESARTENKHHALCYLDLDQFKVVNDTCGHIAGDELLKQLAALLQTKVRDVDTLARLGGDEFGILLEGCPLEKARQIGNNLRRTVKDFRFVWEDKSFEVGCSIGLVPITNHTNSLSDLLRAADAACYVAKDLGRNRVYAYKPDDEELARRHGEMQWITRLHTALEFDKFELYYQPIVPLSANNAQGERGEILLRMHDENDQQIPPMAFIPAAERYGMMPAIDRWIVEKTFTSISNASAKRREEIDCLAINLSGQSLSDETFLDFVLNKLDESAVMPDQICFEITETAAIANPQGAVRFIDHLRARGCHFALDDFGSGLSSFAYLKDMNVDFLKIDGYFVRDIADDPIDLAMVESINHIGHVMGIKTVAEFVESESVIIKLKELGVDYAQGYYIAKPQPLSESLLAIP
ncbi:MAG: PAS domain S-box protein [Gammaproteobacteria bacterium]|nr:PAS domain S-box protein [Gammaproteobacteria bacterium]